MSGNKGMSQQQNSIEVGEKSAESKHAEPTPERDLPVEAREVIGRQLRKAYDARLSEPIPEKFTKLLDALAKGEGS